LDGLTVVVCSNRPLRLARSMEILGPALTLASARGVWICDSAITSPEKELLANRLPAGGVLRVLGANLGLASARNIAIAATETPYMLFLDDDVVISPAAVARIQAGLSEYDIVGAFLIPPKGLYPDRWFLSEGQYHYLGWHNPCRRSRWNRPWGACLAINVARARLLRITFPNVLGRQGENLASGDDTEFCRRFQMAGGRISLLTDALVVHDVDVSRVSFRYVARRAYWQGRSEVRRGRVLEAVSKELHRFTCTSARPVQRIALCILYFTILVGGILRETLTSRSGPL
jgi:GT2 family glycosyltransferase